MSANVTSNSVSLQASYAHRPPQIPPPFHPNARQPRRQSAVRVTIHSCLFVSLSGLINSLAYAEETAWRGGSLPPTISTLVKKHMAGIRSVKGARRNVPPAPEGSKIISFGNVETEENYRCSCWTLRPRRQWEIGAFISQRVVIRFTTLAF